MLKESDLISSKKWLLECLHMSEDLFKVSKKYDDKDIVDYISDLFPVFNTVPYYDAFISYQTDSPYGNAVEQKAQLYIRFSNLEHDYVENWFKESLYKGYNIGRVSMGTSDWCLIYDIELIIQSINDFQINSLHKQLADEAYEFMNSDTDLFDDYYDKCLAEDPHYLGVRFIEYTGEFPSYCYNGTVVLEINGERVSFKANDLWESFSASAGYLSRDANLGKYERYRNEIARLLKENLRGCCGGCE